MPRSLIALLAVLAVANPLCCWGGEAAAADATVMAADTSCCGPSAPAGDLPAEDGTPEHTCPHDNGSTLVAENHAIGKIVHTSEGFSWVLLDNGRYALRGGRREGAGYGFQPCMEGRYPPPFSAFCSYLI